MDAVLLSISSAFFFGAMTVALRFALRDGADAFLGAVVTSGAATVVASVAAPVAGGSAELGDLAFFALIGLIAPGASQLFFTFAVRDAGPSRTSVVVGTAPLFAVAIAVVFLDEELEAPLALGALLIVGAGILLVSESGRPGHVRLVGIGFALACTLLFSTRDNLVRNFSQDTEVASVAGAAVALGVATVACLGAWLALNPNRVGAAFGRLPVARFALAGLFFGLSYVTLFEAYYRGRVSVVSPLVATESLWGVLLSALFLRRTELVGLRLVLGAALVVAGGALIGFYR